MRCSTSPASWARRGLVPEAGGAARGPRRNVQSALDRILSRETWHNQSGGGWIGGAIYGVNDGLAAVFGVNAVVMAIGGVMALPEKKPSCTKNSPVLWRPYPPNHPNNFCVP